MITKGTAKALGESFDSMADIKHYQRIADEAGISRSTVLSAANDGYLDWVYRGHYSPGSRLRQFIIYRYEAETVSSDSNTTSDGKASDVIAQPTPDLTFHTPINLTAIQAFVVISNIAEPGLSMETVEEIVQALHKASGYYAT